MKIKFINHACFIVENGSKKVMCDPWFKGSIFDNGWSLLEDRLSECDYDYDHVWISHEHPDHFRPGLFCDNKISNQKKIILQSRPKDKKLHNWFENRGYDVSEIPDDGYLYMDNNFKLCGDLNYDFDSWVCFKSGNKTILNLNDCISFKTDSEIQEIKNKVGDIDVLLAQFSFANWTGNRGDNKTPQRAKKVIFNNLERIFKIIKPKYIIPFASFVYFSHEENFYLNDNSIKIDDFINYFSKEKIIVMKPEDQWEISDPWEHNDRNISFWRSRFDDINKKSLTKTKTVGVTELKKSFQVMKQRIYKNNNMSLFSLKVNDFKPSIIFLTDLNKSFSFNILGELKEAKTTQKECDLSMSSESLLNVIKNSWGFGTLMVNGRFQANYKNFNNFVKQTRLDYMNNIGKYFPESIKIKDITNSPSLVNKLVG